MRPVSTSRCSDSRAAALGYPRFAGAVAVVTWAATALASALALGLQCAAAAYQFDSAVVGATGKVAGTESGFRKRIGS